MFEKYKYLFLDRDGVINKRVVNDYISLWEDFHIIPGVLESLEMFSTRFERIVIVTNQQGIGKGIMTESDLEIIHEKFLETVAEKGGRIDKIFHCPELDIDQPDCRKPNIGMARAAKQAFPDIEFEKSLMVGDMITDIEFANNVGMKAIAVGKELSQYAKENGVPYFTDLRSFASSI